MRAIEIKSIDTDTKFKFDENLTGTSYKICISNHGTNCHYSILFPT